MPIIALTRGSLSATFKLAEKLGGELDCPAVSREEVIQHAEIYGIEETGMAASGFMEIQPPHFWDRFAAQRRQYMIYIKASLMDFIKKGNAVYHGHLGQFNLSDIPKLLRIKVDASIDFRIDALVKESGLTNVEAKKHIEEIDSRRKSWAKFLYGVDFNDPMNYDMILNMNRMSLDTMAGIITCAAERPEYKLDEESLKVIKDVHLKSIVLAHLARSPRTRGMDLAVKCDSDNGHVEIRGMGPIVGTDSWKKDIQEVVRAVDGVSSVEIVC